jgi:hypothetical protein
MTNQAKKRNFFTTQFKGKYRNFRKLGHKAAQCKFKKAKEEKNDMNCNYFKKPGHVKANCFKLLMKNQNQGEEN